MKKIISISIFILFFQKAGFGQCVDTDSIRLFIYALNHDLTLKKAGKKITASPLNCLIVLDNLKTKNDTTLYFFDLYLKEKTSLVPVNFDLGYYYCAIGYSHSSKNYFPILNMVKLNFDSKNKTECQFFFQTKIREMMIYISEKKIRNDFIDKMMSTSASMLIDK